MQLTKQQASDKLKDGSLKIDFMSHGNYEYNNDYQKQVKSFLCKLDEEIKRNERYLEDSKEEEEDIALYRTIFIDRKIDIDKDYIYVEYTCPDCGKNLAAYLASEDTLKMFNIVEYNPNKKEGVISKCVLDGFTNRDAIVNEITVTDNNLIFTNYFEEEELRGNSNISINYLAGRVRLMKELADKNVGYAQMGNMSTTIYANSAGDEIILGDEEDDDEEPINHDGFVKLGTISLQVWRWMCADRNVLAAAGEKIPNKILNRPENDNDYIEVKVQPGKWVIEHYYDLRGAVKGIHSKMYLKK